MAVTPHGVLPRDSHEISPTIGGVHELMILLRDLLKEQLQHIFGEEMGGVRGTQTPSLNNDKCSLLFLSDFGLQIIKHDRFLDVFRGPGRFIPGTWKSSWPRVMAEQCR